jgi:hypothetical protein
MEAKKLLDAEIVKNRIIEDKMRQVAVKHDSGKLRYSLLPIYPLKVVCGVFMYGAKKYTDENWRKGFSWRRTYDALMRHITAWFDGEEFDEEGQPHLGCAVCNLFFLIEFSITHREMDDRPKIMEMGHGNTIERRSDTEEKRISEDRPFGLPTIRAQQCDSPSSSGEEDGRGSDTESKAI